MEIIKENQFDGLEANNRAVTMQMKDIPKASSRNI